MDKNIYITKAKKLKGHDYRIVYKQAIVLYKEISSRTKRKPYIKSKYFDREKVFLDYFWHHLMDKTWNERVRRLKLYPCALDLIRNSTSEPVMIDNPNKVTEKLYRFIGVTNSGDVFIVQIKKIKSGDKYFMSVFPK